MASLAGCAAPTPAPATKPAASVSVPTQAQSNTAPAQSQPAAATPAAAIVAPVAGSITPKIVAATEAFLATLSDAQKSKVLFKFDDNAQRARWSNFPTFQRAGLRMVDLTPAQREAAYGILKASLSAKGYQQVIDVMDGDQFYSESQNNNPLFGRDLYWISFLGTPSSTTPWMWQFGGHHFGLNATIAGDKMTLAPSLTGGQPVDFTLNGRTVRTVGPEIDKAFQLVNTLSAEQKAKAIISNQLGNLVLGPGQDGKKISPQGIKVSELNADQQKALLELVGERVGIMNDRDAALKMNEIRAALNDSYFMWSGPITAGSAVYFRFQGPNTIMEYATQNDRGTSNHVHSMYREPNNDYGAQWR